MHLDYNFSRAVSISIQFPIAVNLHIQQEFVVPCFAAAEAGAVHCNLMYPLLSTSSYRVVDSDAFLLC